MALHAGSSDGLDRGRLIEIDNVMLGRKTAVMTCRISAVYYLSWRSAGVIQRKPHGIRRNSAFSSNAMPLNSSELVRASQRGDLSTARKLVEAGADVNGTDEHGTGPLLTFTPAVVEYLLSKGADPNRQRNESGAPVLVGMAQSWASWHWRPKALIDLLDPRK